MSIKIITGNIFTSECQVIVNTINCVGIMGAGIALECRLRYPEMHQKYIKLCKDGKINIGSLWIYKTEERWILNFPTKKHWKYPSKKEYLYAGLDKFLATYHDKGIQSIAFPLLGADKGGIPQAESLKIMTDSLKDANVDIEIYKYDAMAFDDLYQKTKNWLTSQNIDKTSKDTGLSKHYINKVINAMKSPDIFQLNQLGRVDGIGIKTLEKIFNIAYSSISEKPDTILVQPSLLD